MKNKFIIPLLLIGIVFASACIEENRNPQIKVSYVAPIGSIELGVDIPINPKSLSNLFTDVGIKDVPENSTFTTRFTMSNPLEGLNYDNVILAVEYDKNRIPQLKLREPPLDYLGSNQGVLEGVTTTIDSYKLGVLNKGGSQEFLFVGIANPLGLDKVVTTRIYGYLFLQNGTRVASGSIDIKIVSTN